MNTRSIEAPYLTIAEAAALARVSPKRLRNLMSKGTLREGVHYTRPRGLHPRFLRESLDNWIQGRETDEAVVKPQRATNGARCKVAQELIPPARKPRNDGV